MRFLKYLLLYSATAVILIFLALEVGLSYATRDRLYTKINQLPQNKTALLLTTSKTDTSEAKLLPYYQHRIEATVDLYQSGKVTEVLVSGANVGEATVHLAKEDLIKNGVPADRIFLDTCGYNTYESIVRSRVMFRSDSIVIVSQKHHCERALYMAQHKDLHAVAFVARGDGDKFLPGVILHEFLGRIKMFWRLRSHQHPRYLHQCPIY